MAADSISSQYNEILANFLQKQLEGLKQTFASPVTFVMTVLVLALALMLPTWLYLINKTSETPVKQIRQSSQITMFLKLDITAARIQKLVKELKQLPEILKIEYVPKDKALEFFKQESGLAKQITALGTNPLPATLFIEARDVSSVDKVKQLMDHLAKLPQSDLVTMDLYWANKLQAILDISTRLFWLLVFLFSLAFILTIFFAVKTMIQNHLEEISLTLILGATHGYIKQKFVQMGFWLGLFASITCILITNLAVLWIRRPIEEFAIEFAVSPNIPSLGLKESMILILIGTIAGIITAWVTSTGFLFKAENKLHS